MPRAPMGASPGATTAAEPRSRLAMLGRGGAQPPRPAASEVSRRTPRWRPGPRLRSAPANIASLLRASAAVVAPGDAPIVPEAAEDNPLTGDFEEIVRVRRPISSRWRPGEIVIPRQPGRRRPGLRRHPNAGLPPAGGPPQPPAPAEPAARPPADAAPQARPEWPSVTARLPVPRNTAPSRRPTPPAPPGRLPAGPFSTGPRPARARPAARRRPRRTPTATARRPATPRRALRARTGRP